MFDGIIESIIGSRPHKGKSVPVCIMQDHPDLSEIYQFYEREMAAFRARVENLEKEMDLQKKCFWDRFDSSLVEKGLLTQKEVDRSINLRINDGVVFKLIENEEI